jgi:hypothetical protein
MKFRLHGKQAKQTHTWQYAPYPFEPGQKYVLELNASDIMHVKDLEYLQRYFDEQGIICHVILTKTGNGIKPVQVKTFLQESE